MIVKDLKKLCEALESLGPETDTDIIFTLLPFRGESGQTLRLEGFEFSRLSAYCMFFYFTVDVVNKSESISDEKRGEKMTEINNTLVADLIQKKNFLRLHPLVVETDNKNHIQQIVKGMKFVAVDVDYQHGKVVLIPSHD